MSSTDFQVEQPSNVLETGNTPASAIDPTVAPNPLADPLVDPLEESAGDTVQFYLGGVPAFP